MDLIILHLSDIHIKTASDPVLARGEKIAKSVFKHLPDCKHLVILISGDIAFSGKSDQYLLAERLIQSITESIKTEKDIPITIVTTPGNHDVDFEKNDQVRMMVVDSIHKDLGKIDDAVIRTCTSIQSSYFEFRNKIENHSVIDRDELWRTSSIEIESTKIGIESLNISWISKVREEQGKLLFPYERYKAVEDDGIDIRIVTMHHPFNWFNQSNYRDFRKFIKTVSDLLITGHEHQGNSGVLSDTESGDSAFVEGCVLQDEGGASESSFNIIIVDTIAKTFSVEQIEYKNKIYSSISTEDQKDIKPLPGRNKFPFQVLPKFKEILEDPGAYFKSPGGCNLKLSDVFVFPDIKRAHPEEGKRYSNNVGSESLLQTEFIEDGILLEGAEKVGTTSLLYQLYTSYYHKGFVPIYLQGSEIRKGTSGEIDGAIRKAFLSQYGKTKIELFQQLEKAKKILLLDDFDESPIKSSSLRADIIQKLKERFSYIIISVDDMFEVKEMLESDVSDVIKNFEHYRIQPLGYAKRANLIEKWVSLDCGTTINNGEFIAKCDKAERLANAVLSKSLIPTIPLHLITLLQSMDSGRSGDFQDSALGYYYQYLLTEAFQQAGTKAEMLTEVYQYCSHLAWKFHVLNSQSISIHQFREFNKIFSENWHTVDLDSRIDLLVAARVINRDEDQFSFRYPYMYYYLKGLYIKDQIDDEGMREYIEHCCQHLYVRDHANTILFLVHHTNDDFVLKSIADSLHSLFPDRHPIDLYSDTGSIKELIKDGPDLEYDNQSPSMKRKQTNEIRDEMEPSGDGLAEREENNGTLSLFAQIAMLFKTNEILGQVLKNQYSKIRRPRKKELISEIFNGPLRALDDFYIWISKNPNHIIEIINSEIKRKGNVKNEEGGRELAKKIVAGFIQLVSFSFIHRTAQGINSESLYEDIDSVVRDSENMSYKLIDLSIKLDSQKPIPRGLIEEVIKKTSGDPHVNKLIQVMVINRLYMFETTATDKTWLDQKGIISIRAQQSLSYRKQIDGV